MSLSIIIPIFNGELTITRTLDSITESYLNLTEKNESMELELILVNDGSTDETLRTLSNYKFPNRIKVNIINQTNQGVSKARNNGLSQVTCNFVTFVDADDEITNDYFEKLVPILKNTDFDILKYDLRIRLDGRLKNSFPYPHEANISKKYSSYKTICELFTIEDERHFGYAAGKVYRMSLLNENNVKFRGDLSYSEDVIFLMDCLEYTEKILYLPKQLYIYDKVSGLPTYLKKANVLEHELLLFHQILAEKIRKRPDSEKLILKYLNYRLSSIIMLCLAGLKLRERHIYAKVYKNNKEYIRFSYLFKGEFRTKQRKIIYLLFLTKSFKLLDIVFRKYLLEKQNRGSK